MGEDLDWLGGTSIQAAISMRVTFCCTWKSAPCSFAISTVGVINNSAIFSDIWATPEHSWAQFIATCAGWKSNRSNRLWPSKVKVRSEIPSAAGLASSAALCVAGVAASNGTADFQYLSRECWFVEREILSRDVGPMDYFPCIVGGVIEASCGSSGVERIAQLNWPKDARLIVVDTLVKRDTSEVVSWKRSRWSHGDRSVARYISSTKELALQLSEILSRSPRPQLLEIGRILTKAHVSLRDDMGVSNKIIEDCVNTLLRSGAAGAKITGTGKGGCVFAVVHETDMEQVLGAIKRMPVNAVGASVDSEGVKLAID